MPRSYGSRLSPAQLRFAVLLADTELNVPAISKRLGVQSSTGYRHRAEIFAKLGVSDRDGLRAALLECEIAAAGR